MKNRSRAAKINTAIGLIATFCVALAVASYIWQGNKPENKLSGDDSFFTGDIRGGASNNTPKNEPPKTTPGNFPPSLNRAVAFTPQAPTANWDTLHNDACEEASVIMAHFYFSNAKVNETKIAAATVETEITKLTEWQDDNLGYHLSIDTPEVKRMAEEVYGLKTKIIRNFSEADLKQELADNHLIILPADGRLLGNPNFRPPGPPYHMLVIKGYDSSGFITNDPGTRLGHNYPYTYDVLYDSTGEYDHSTKAVDTSNKQALVVWK
jgi:hypothetical protein